ncbi:heterodisulfide reductase-related iron-sulfur binding cluster [Chloroflexota bacterium]
MTTDAIPVTSKTSNKKWTNLGVQVKDFLVQIIGQARILNKIYPGIMHFLIFWGVAIQVVGTAINLMQMKLFLPWEISNFPRSNLYLGYELIMDMAGLFIFLGIIMAATRRYIIRPKTLITKWDDTVALILLFLIVLVGFTNESMRIIASNPPWANWSPIGNWLSKLLSGMGLQVSQAITFHDTLVWVHISLALLLVGLVPFTKMRHLVNTPLNILFHPRRKIGEIDKIEDIETTELLGVGKINEFNTQQLLSFDACVRCGRCEEACPANYSGMAYSPRELIQNLRTSMLDNLVHPQTQNISEISFNDEYAWFCTTCGACLEECPAFIRPVDEIVDLRRYQVLSTGKMPKSIGDTMRNLERQGNPWGMPPENRMAWAEGLNVREISPGEETDILLFTGCAASFDERNKKVTRSLVKLLQKLEVDFAVLGFDEMCCGETARRMGHEYIFQEFAKQNIESFGKIKFNRILTSCPHCFNTLKNEYPQMEGDYLVQHYSEYLAEKDLTDLVQSTSKTTLTFHDSCYLGRYNKVYNAPRKLLDEKGVNRVEMKRQKEDAFCCGGGGGGMWMEVDANTRINHRRLLDAMDVKAEVVATSCPYCLTMMEDAINSKGLGGEVRVLDIAEILVEGME